MSVRTGSALGLLASLGVLASLPLVVGGCGGEARRTAVLVGTTSTRDAGMLDSLTRAFEASYPDHRVRPVAVGSGEALELARRGDADVLLVHAPEGERALVEDGVAVRRVPLMTNRFLLVGPPHDPAGAAGTDDVVEAFREIHRSAATFVSRGDDSGTHRKEREIWRAAGIDPAGEGYREVGMGMSETLLYASERGAYTLAVSANVAVLGDRLDLRVLVEADPLLRNVYSVLRMADPPHPGAARVLEGWLLSREAREVIRGFGRQRHGVLLFRPVSSPEGAREAAGGAARPGAGEPTR